MQGKHRLVDSHGRVLRDLRVSVTDRCNLRCLYCLPETEAAEQWIRKHWNQSLRAETNLPKQVPRAQILTFEEIERLVRISVDLGIKKIRLTGGEPLLRQSIDQLVERLSRVEGVVDLAMTSNGHIFLEKGQALRKAGLHRISFSLDSLDRANYQRITGYDGRDKVLSSINLARELGFQPVKVNAVIIRGLNDHEIEDLAEFGHQQDLSIRFIEFMPLDSARAWSPELVVSGREILSRLQARFELRRVVSENSSETAKRWRFADGRGEIGLITTLSEPFCEHCNRLRLTADGKLRTCLFSKTEHDLRSRLRNGESDEQLRSCLQQVALQKEDGHYVGQTGFTLPERSMSCIGG